jgi:mannobiose 2-epimerase
MPNTDALATLRDEMRRELTDHLLPFWYEHAIDEERGGFIGQMTTDNRVVPDAKKGAVLNARILWTFAAVYRQLGSTPARAFAERARHYLNEHFWDGEYGGIYWMLEADGTPAETRKQIYAQAFALYAFAEDYRATGHEPSRERAIALFRLIEEKSFDVEHSGYREAFRQDWGPLDDVRLSEKDLNARKSMNTHLHVLEAYTTLYQVWPDDTLRSQLERLLADFLEHVMTPEGHLRLFFDEDWTALSRQISYGHDIEASWLLQEAAKALGNGSLQQAASRTAVSLARTTLREGQDADGGILFEGGPEGVWDGDKHYWPQAEAVVGFLNAYQETGERPFLKGAQDVWVFVQEYLVDRTGGEWYLRVRRDGTPVRDADKIGPWKGPYHHVRACLEVMARVGALTEEEYAEAPLESDGTSGGS